MPGRSSEDIRIRQILCVWVRTVKIIVIEANWDVDAHPLPDIDGQDAVGSYGAVY